VKLVCVKDQAGRVCYHYAQPQPKGRDFGPLIPWLSEGQAAHLLRCRMVEKVDDGGAASPDRVVECLEALNALELPAEVGAERARRALRQDGKRYGNDTIAAALRARKRRPVRDRTADSREGRLT